MTTRFCPICATEVEDTGGFCLLGHSLKVASAVPEMSELRTEVRTAFEEARAEVAAALADAERSDGGPEQPGSTASPDVARTVQERRASMFSALADEPSPGPTDPISAFAPPPRMDWGPTRGFMKLRRSGSRRLRLEEATGR
jgi:hypothetical protein